LLRGWNPQPNRREKLAAGCWTEDLAENATLSARLRENDALVTPPLEVCDGMWCRCYAGHTKNIECGKAGLSMSNVDNMDMVLRSRPWFFQSLANSDQFLE
jgi:hypothetical protein